MTVYTRFGSRVSLTARAGEHEAKGFQYPVTLVKGTYLDEPDHPEGFFLVHTLRADGGAAAIDATVAALPHVELGPEELKKALREAS